MRALLPECTNVPAAKENRGDERIICRNEFRGFLDFHNPLALARKWQASGESNAVKDWSVLQSMS
jgi:hypothetical protein